MSTISKQLAQRAIQAQAEQEKTDQITCCLLASAAPDWCPGINIETVVDGDADNWSAFLLYTDDDAPYCFYRHRMHNTCRTQGHACILAAYAAKHAKLNGNTGGRSSSDIRLI